jgi:hypothetical protein
MIEFVCIYKNQFPLWLDQNWIDDTTRKIEQQRDQTIKVELVLVDATTTPNPIPVRYRECLNHKTPPDFPVFFMYEDTLSTVQSIWGQQVAEPTTIENLIGSYFPP